MTSSSARRPLCSCLRCRFAAGGVALAEPIIDAVFGNAYGDAVPVFQVLLVSLPLSFPAWILLPAILVGERTGSAGRILAVALTANVAANLALVSSGGIVASAWITVATDAGIALATTAVLARHGVVLRWLRLAAPALPAAALVALAAFALRDLPLPVPVLAGALVYAAGLKLAGFPERLGISGFGGLLGEPGRMTQRRSVRRRRRAYPCSSRPTGGSRGSSSASRALRGSSRVPTRSLSCTAPTTRRRVSSSAVGPRGTRSAIGRSRSTRRESSPRCAKGSRLPGAT